MELFFIPSLLLTTRITGLPGTWWVFAHLTPSCKTVREEPVLQLRNQWYKKVR